MKIFMSYESSVNYYYYRCSNWFSFTGSHMLSFYTYFVLRVTGTNNQTRHLLSLPKEYWAQMLNIPHILLSFNCVFTVYSEQTCITQFHLNGNTLEFRDRNGISRESLINRMFVLLLFHLRFDKTKFVWQTLFANQFQMWNFYI